MFWIFIGFLSLVAVAIVLYPLIRRGTRAAGQETHSVGVYREQLGELDRDLAAGSLTQEQAGAARLEIERRILAATTTAKAPPSGIGTVGRRVTVAAIALALPAGALLLYLFLGAPNLLDRPLAQRGQELQALEQRQQLEEFAHTLTARVEKQPDDAKAWTMLGRLYRMLGRFSKSAKAYGQAHALKPQEADAAANHAEALVYVSGGTVSETAEKMFAAVLATDPKHVKARFYLGSALAQRPKDLPKAIEIWSSLERDSPPDSPWLDILRQNLRMAETQLASLTQARPKNGPDGGALDAEADAGAGTQAKE